MAGRRWAPIAALAFLSPVVAELVASGNLPTVLFLNPLIALLFCAIYGPAALLLRELWVRGRAGWPGMLVLGAAYAAFNEGIIANTWFEPGALDMTARELGRHGSVNWNLVTLLIIFHTFLSMFVPIALAELSFPERAGRPWLERRGLVVCTAIATLLAIGSIASREDHLVRDRPERTVTLVLIVLAVVAVVFVVPRSRIPTTLRRVPRVRSLFWVGFAWFAVYLFCFFGLTRLAPAVVPFAALAIWGTAVALLLRWTGSRQWTKRHTLLLCAGVVAPSMILTSWRIIVLQPVSSALFVYFLVRLDRRLRAAAVSG
jgi:hypothetical protein